MHSVMLRPGPKLERFESLTAHQFFGWSDGAPEGAVRFSGICFMRSFGNATDAVPPPAAGSRPARAGRGA